MPIVNLDDFLTSKLDYIVVGGGTVGLVVAARLAENTDCVVGVVEAGEYHENESEVDVPAMIARNILNPKFDWGFSSVPQKYANDREILQSRGKGLGGSSMLNFLAAVRPSKEELNAFEDLGNPGWNWDTMLKYMKKSEHLNFPDLSPENAKRFAASPNPALHGTDGPIAKSFPSHVTEFHSDLLDSLEYLGIPRNPDNSGGNPVGSILLPTSVDSKTAKRSYAAPAYYVPNAERSNLLVLTGAYATKIRLKEGEGGMQRATGVDIVKGGVAATVNVSKEVILSTGSFQSPQLLELSGIGDKRILSSLGIDCVIDLPGVGENLQDHAFTPTLVEVDKKIESMEILRDPVQLERQQELYKQQKGILSGTPSSCFAFLPAKAFGSDKDVQGWVAHADIDKSRGVFIDTHPTVKRGIAKQYAIMRRLVDDPEQALSQLLHLNGHYIPGLPVESQKRYITILCAYTRPFSRGTVHTTSKDPMTPPAIQQNYFSNPADLDILVKTLHFMTRLYNTKPVANLVVSKLLPAFGDAEMDDEMLREYVRSTLSTVHHPVGTASMLPREDGGVVGSDLLVYGTTNLRVADCSIIPLQISSNIQTVAYAIGEKAADIIIKDI